MLAAYDHIKWVQRVTAALDDPAIELDADGIADPHACRFGAWFDVAGRRQYGHLPAFVAIEPLHRRIHELAREMLARRDSGMTELARHCADEIVDTKERIVALLGSLRGALLEAAADEARTT